MFCTIFNFQTRSSENSVLQPKDGELQHISEMHVFVGYTGFMIKRMRGESSGEEKL